MALAVSVSSNPYLVAGDTSVVGTMFLVTGATGAITWTIYSELPPGLSLTPFAPNSRYLYGNPTVAGDYPIGLTVTDAAGNIATVSVTVHVVSPLAFANLLDPDYGTTFIFRYGRSIDIPFIVTGGHPGYTYDFVEGPLPSWLSVVGGHLVGTAPSSEQLVKLTARATDQDGRTANSNVFWVNVALFPPTMKGSAPARTTAGQPYDGGKFTADSSVTGGVYAVTAGALPSGIVLNAGTGALSGAATVPGSYAGIVVTYTDSSGTVSSDPFTITVDPYEGSRFYSVLVPDPGYLSGAPLSALRREDWTIFKLSIKDSLTGEAARVQVDILNPGADGLMKSVGLWVLLWHEPSPGVMTVLATGKIVAMPNGFASQSAIVTVEMECRPDQYQLLLLEEAERLISASPLNGGLVNFNLDPLMYNRQRGPSVADYMEGTITVPFIDRRNHSVAYRPRVAWVDVDPARAAGSFDSTYAGRVIDVTDFVVDFDLRRTRENSTFAVTSQMSVTWTQSWQGFCDITADMKFKAFTDSMPHSSGGSSGFGRAVWNPAPLESSLPTAGGGGGAGWQYISCISTTQLSSDSFSYTTTERNNLIANGYVSQSGGLSATIDWSFIQPVNFVLMGSYRQLRAETIVVTTTIDLQDAAIRASSPLVIENQNVDDPTVDKTGPAWTPRTAYNRGDVRWYGGVAQYCIVPHVAGDTFDPSKWVALAAQGVDKSGQEIKTWAPGAHFLQGDLVSYDGGIGGVVIYVSLKDQTAGSSFDTSGFSQAAQGYKLRWAAGVNYAAGTEVTVNGESWFRITTGISLSTWAADMVFWLKGTASLTAVAPGSPAYFSTARGAFSIKHRAVRSFSKMLNDAMCLEAAIKMPFGVVIDVAHGTRSEDLLPGMCLRVRTARVPGSVGEVIGIVSEMTIDIDGDNGTGYVSVNLGIVPGNGLARWAAGTTTVAGVIPDDYGFDPPSVPIEVGLLGASAYVLLDAKCTGPSWTSTKNLISDACASALSSSALEGAVNGLIQDAKVTYSHKLRPLEQSGTLELSYRECNMQRFAAPKNIVLS